MSSSRIGVLALQGDYEAHLKALARASENAVETIEVRRPADLESIAALIIPGGESTVMGMLLERFGMFELLKSRIANGMPVFATCAGIHSSCEEHRSQRSKLASAFSMSLSGAMPMADRSTASMRQCRRQFQKSAQLMACLSVRRR